MGVTGLWKLIEQSGKPVPLETLEGKVLAIDISIWLHQAVKGFQDNRGGAVQNAHLSSLFNRLCKLLYFRIKPVFVFDGGVPQLKRMTIEKRSMQRSKTQNEANRVEQILLETLAKEKIVQQALGKSVKDIVSPRKAQQARENRTKDDEMFVLPPLEDSLGVSRLDSDSDDEKDPVKKEENIIGELCASEIAKIDVTHPLFKSLPPDKRHAILFELKETRKQSSWGRLHEMPPEGGNFSDFQMKRLLKRRNVQVSLEEAELEMGGKSLSLMELDEMLREDGIVEGGDTKGQRIASNENARFVYIKDTLKAIEESKKLLEEESQKRETIPEEDIDLQMAIAMSLQDDDNPANLTQVDVAKDSEIRLSTPQRERFKNINKAPAREYMLEYGILNDDTIQDMFKGKKTENVKPVDTVSISSSTDSDFIDVPEDDFSTEVLAPPNEPFPMPDETSSKDFRIEDLHKAPVEVVIDPTKAINGCDDLFADIFEPKNEIIDAKSDTEDLNKTQPLDLTEYEKILNVSTPGNDSKRPETSDSENESPCKKIKLDVSDDSTSPCVTETPKEVTPVKKRSISDVSKDESSPKKARTNEITEAVTIIDSDNDEIVDVLPKSDVTVEKTPKKSEEIESVTIKCRELHHKTPEKTHLNVTPVKRTPPKPSPTNEPQPSSSKEVPVMILPSDEQSLREMEQELAQQHRDLEREMNKFDRHAVSVTERMSMDCKELLKLFGIPYIVAPMEAEAQCAFLNKYGLVDGIISDDSDVWLFGGSVVYKNFFDNKKVVLEYRSENIKNLFQMDQAKLIQLGMLVGSDYTSGIQGIGPVTALEIIAAFSTNDDYTDEAVKVISCLRKFRDWWMNGKTGHSSHLEELKKKLKKVELIEGFPNLDVVRAYLYPEVDLDKDPFSWGSPDVEALYELTRRHLGWTKNKTDDILAPVMKKLNDKRNQVSIRNYFNVKEIKHHKELVVSKRTEKSIKRLAGEVTVEEEKPKKGKKRQKKKDTRTEDPTSSLIEITDESSEPSSSQGIFESPTKTQTIKFVRPSPKKTPEKKKGKNLVEKPKPEPKRVPRIPNPHPVIPQRVKDQKQQEEKKKKAAEIFNKKNK